MYFLSPPSKEKVQTFISQYQSSPFSYNELGISLENFPQHSNTSQKFKKDEYQISLGYGRECFAKAQQAVKDWGMFALDWIRLYPAKPKIQEEEMVGVLIHSLGIWVLNFCRIVKVMEGERQFGFSYGTLRPHAERGEEKFLVTWSKDNDEVSYKITAFSRPNYFLAKLGYPYVRSLQKRFSRESLQKMKKLVHDANSF